MKLSTVLTLAAYAVAAYSCAVDGSTNAVKIKGYKMFDSVTGKYFPVKGIDYYPRPNTGELDVNNHDFFTDDYADVWGPDLEYLSAAGANAVRLYAVDPSKSHDKFMCALSKRGMYALIDLAASCEGCAITADDYPTCYPSALKSRGEQIISAFAKYDNVLAFSAGNEVNNAVTDGSKNAPCQKKFLRDMRKFIASCSSMRAIPVGVVVADPALTNNNRELNAKYYNCRTSSSDTYENAEWYGINAYQYCDSAQTTLDTATGFKQLSTDFLSYEMTIPVLLTEFGCLNEGFPNEDDYEAQRTWLQAGWLHSSTFRQSFNGGFVFEFSTENFNSKSTSEYPFTSYGAQNYGLGYYSPEDCDHTSVPCVFNPMPNYDNLAAKYNATVITDQKTMSKFTSDRTTLPTCPTGWPALASITWDADDVDSLTCPTTTALSFDLSTCAASTTTNTNTGTAASGSSSGSSTSSKSDAARAATGTVTAVVTASALIGAIL